MVLMVAAARRCATMLSAPWGFGAFWGPGLRRFRPMGSWRCGGCLRLAVRRFCASRAAFLGRAGKEALQPARTLKRVAAALRAVRCGVAVAGGRFGPARLVCLCTARLSHAKSRVLWGFPMTPGP